MVVYVINIINIINVVKKRVKFGKKMCGLNVEILTTVQKTFVLQLWPPANVRELTRAHANGARLKSRRTYNVRELRHDAWVNSRRGIFGNHSGRECFVINGFYTISDLIHTYNMWSTMPYNYSQRLTCHKC